MTRYNDAVPLSVPMNKLIKEIKEKHELQAIREYDMNDPVLIQHRCEELAEAYRRMCHKSEVYELALRKIEIAGTAQLKQRGRKCKEGSMLAMVRHTLGMKGE